MQYRYRYDGALRLAGADAWSGSGIAAMSAYDFLEWGEGACAT
jgi:hypothetical protein